MAAFVRTFADADCPKFLINVSSGAAYKGYPGWSLYCAAKAGTDNFIRSLAVEQSHRERPVIAVNFEPGVVDTAMQEEIRGADETHFPVRERFLKLKEDGALRAPDTVAEALIGLLDRELENGGRYSVNNL